MRFFRIALCAAVCLWAASGCREVEAPTEPPQPKAPAVAAEDSAEPASEEPSTQAQQQQTEAALAQENKAVLEAACTKCHPVAKVYSYDGSQDWQSIVTRMIEKRGAQVDPADAKRIVAYLNTMHSEP